MDKIQQTIKNETQEKKDNWDILPKIIKKKVHYVFFFGFFFFFFLFKIFNFQSTTKANEIEINSTQKRQRKEIKTESIERAPKKRKMSNEETYQKFSKTIKQSFLMLLNNKDQTYKKLLQKEIDQLKNYKNQPIK